MTTLPWAPKLLYGIVTDNLPICGSTKKNYIVLMGTIQVACALALGLISFDSASVFILFVTLVMLTSAVMDVVVDGLMVSQSRLDPKSGSEDLQSYCWGIGGVGGMVGLLLGGWLTEEGYS